MNQQSLFARILREELYACKGSVAVNGGFRTASIERVGQLQEQER
jgi:hypothetical protein